MRERDPRRRSDEIRRKLNQDSQSAIHQAARRVVAPPVVQSRGLKELGQLPDHLMGETNSAIRRHFKPGWRLLSFALVGLLSYALFNAWTSPEYKVSAIEVSGLQRIGQEEVLKNLNLNGAHIFALQPDEITRAIASLFPELREIRVRTSFPAQVDITVAERQPMFAWQMKNRLLWVDTEGYLIPARGIVSEMLTIHADALPTYQLARDLKEIEGIKAIQDKTINKPGISDLTFFSQPKHMEAALLSGVLQLNAWMPNEPTLLYQKQRGLGWKDTRGWEVFVGQKLENINDKMVMYETVVRELEKEGIDPSLVSVEFLHAPYYRVD